MGVNAFLVFPFLRSLRLEAAEQSPFNLLYYVTFNGTPRNYWRPSGSGANYNLPELTNSLNPHKSDLTIADGLFHYSGMLSTNGTREQIENPHNAGLASVLTGAEITGKFDTARPKGPSIDQFIRQKVGQKVDFIFNPFNIINSPSGRNNISFNQNGKSVNSSTSLTRIFDSVFGQNISRVIADNTGGADKAKALQELKKSQYDKLAKEFTSLKRLLSASEYSKVQDLIEEVEDKRKEIQSQLMNEIITPVDPGVKPGQCNTSNLRKLTGNDDSGVEARLRMGIDMAVTAMKCGLINVGVISCGYGQAPNGVRFALKNNDRSGWHEISHSDPGQNKYNKHRQVFKWTAEQYAYLVGEMKKNGLMDNTLSVWTSSYGGNDASPNHHIGDNPIYYLAGNMNNYFKKGHYVKFGRPSRPSWLQVPWAVGVGSKNRHEYVLHKRNNADFLSTVTDAMGLGNQFGYKPTGVINDLKS